MIDRNTLLRTVAFYGKGDWNSEYQIIKEKRKFTDDEIKNCATLCVSPMISIGDEYYPKNFVETPNPPIVFFYYGNIELLKPKYKKLGVVGSREPNFHSKKNTEGLLDKIISKEENIVIVSGMASGIDSISHRVAMKYNKPTIAIMGNGIETYYPNQSKDIYEYCKSGKGLLISEYPTDVPPNSENFPKRNRMIAALSDVLFIPQGKDKSGTSITLKYALSIGKTICCLPCHLDEDQLTNNAIKDGAYLVNCPNDILEHFPLK